MQIEDVSPRADNTTIDLGDDYQSVSGKALCVTVTRDGRWAYLGGHSGVWKSGDGGTSWRHLEWAQPGSGQTAVPGALVVPNVYDLLVAPGNPNVVLAATGRDARQPAQSGIYRTTDGGRTWARVHAFLGPSDVVGLVGSLAAAPDDANVVFAAGQFAVAASTDGGATWTSRLTMPSSGRVYYVAAGPQRTAARHVYAAGSSIWHSSDGGQTWQQATGGPSLGSPADGSGQGARSIAVHPSNPLLLYVKTADRVWRGDFSSPGGSWQELPSPRMDYAGTTASGADYVVAHLTPAGGLLLFAADRRTVHVASGEPTSTASWTRIDTGNVHLDPHGIARTPDFSRSPAGGRMLVTSDGGVYVSDDGARTWRHGRGLSTLGLVNGAVLPRPGGKPGICIGMGDNTGFYTADGGGSWRTQDYVGGDNDACFADPRQPHRLIVFAPRSGNREIYLYTASEGQLPDAFYGTTHRQNIPGPPPATEGGKAGWNAVSNFFNSGYRPLVLTLDGESPRPDGDLVTIRSTGSGSMLLRTTAISQIIQPADWATTATAEGPGVKVFQQGPALPDATIDVVQASGGHARPTFYVSNPETPTGRPGLWKWRQGMSAWQQLVPGPAGRTGPVPAVARRFFVDPYRPGLVYVLDADHVRRSDDGGTSWHVDASLERALTENGAFPFVLPYDATPGEMLVRDMIFDPTRAAYRFAVGPAGVFFTVDGVRWDHLVVSTAMSIRPVNAVYDALSDSCNRALYVATSNRGLLRLRPLPPDWDFPKGSLQATSGRVTLLRVHDVGTGYGPPNDSLDAEVVVWLDREPGKAFGLQLRPDAHEEAASGMLALLRDSFNRGDRVRIEFVRTGCRVARIVRVIEDSDAQSMRGNGR